jgi:hypothetical protein
MPPNVDHQRPGAAVADGWDTVGGFALGADGRLTSALVTDAQIAEGARLAPLDGEARPLPEWLTTFQLATVVLDPFTHESGWIIDTAGRILQTFDGADCRVAWIITGTPDQARMFLGPWAQRFLTFVDPDREVVKALGVETLPAFLQIRQDATVPARAEGWEPEAWHDVAASLAKEMSWLAPVIPELGDPAPYPGTVT